MDGMAVASIDAAANHVFFAGTSVAQKSCPVIGKEFL
jgi:hypothetical protein